MTHITIDTASGASLSTLCDFPAKLIITAKLELPGHWMRGHMKGLAVRAIERIVSGATVLGSAAGGAVLMNYLVPGEVGAITGLFAGGGFGIAAVVVLKFSEMKLAGPGVGFQMKLEAIAKDAEEARKLAQLTAEIAFDIGNRPRGVVGGGSLSQNDAVRKLIAERLLEFGFDKAEASRVARFDDPHIARRIIQLMILKAVRRADAGGEKMSNELSLKLLGRDADKTPEGIKAALGGELLQDDEVQAGVRFYQQWYESDAKLYFVIDNLSRLHAAEQREKSIVS
ncbi:hypothetical protein P7F60_29015 [Rhizobium sp. YJ-22]|uniref:hypothetical protein n=1 Tax=Rhizobium sp. YJ-22 TaxID=3037556 RepID=UPI0024126370|nr:hypothetical protein [Rhizobium sp. YJ-22]MDG3580425.1 hypothetical protein [Rhizobium sp. YJ-22]